MRDFPMFTTQNGVASIVLKEVPYKGIAYITIRASLDPAALLKECVAFCRTVGAETVLAKDNPVLAQYPLHTSVLQMCCARRSLEEGKAALFPVTEETAERWRALYNEKMNAVPNSATITQSEMNDWRGKAYFIHQAGVLIGLGAVDNDKVDAIISLIPGMGREVMLTLCNAIYAEQVLLEVASTNHQAVRLYENLGFLPVKELSRWYDVSSLR